MEPSARNNERRKAYSEAKSGKERPKEQKVAKVAQHHFRRQAGVGP